MSSPSSSRAPGEVAEESDEDEEEEGEKEDEKKRRKVPAAIGAMDQLEVEKLRAALAEVPHNTRLKELVLDLGEFSLDSLIHAAMDVAARSPKGALQALPEAETEEDDDESDLSSEFEEDDEKGVEECGALGETISLENMEKQLDPSMVTEVLKMLVMLNEGLQVRGCSCKGGIHTCMSPVASILSTQIHSLQQSLAHSVNQSISNTRAVSRRDSLEKQASRRGSMENGASGASGASGAAATGRRVSAERLQVTHRSSVDRLQPKLGLRGGGVAESGVGRVADPTGEVAASAQVPPPPQPVGQRLRLWEGDLSTSASKSSADAGAGPPSPRAASKSPSPTS